MDGKSRQEIFAEFKASQGRIDNNQTTDPADGEDLGHNDTQNSSMPEDTSLRDTTHSSVCISEGEEADIEHMTTRLAELQEVLRGKEAVIESLTAEIKNAKYQQEFKKMQETYENLLESGRVWVLPKQRLEEKEEHVQKLTEQIRNLQESMSRANSELERVNSEKKSLEKEVKDLKNNRDKVMSEHQTELERVKQLEKQLEDLRDKIRSKEADAEHKYQKLLEKNNQLQAECKQLMGGLQSAWNYCADKEQVLTRIANESRFGDSIGALGLSRTLPRDNLVDDRNSTIGSEVKVSSFVDGIASTLNRYESMLKDCSKAADDNDQLREDNESLKLSVDAVEREKNELIEEIGKLRKEHEQEISRMKKAHRDEVQENASFKKASSSTEGRRKKKISFTLDEEEDQMNETIPDNLERDPDYTPRQHLEISPLPGPRTRSKSPVSPQPLVLQQPLPAPIRNTGTGTIREPIPSPAPAYLRGSVGPVGVTGPSRRKPVRAVDGRNQSTEPPPPH